MGAIVASGTVARVGGGMITKLLLRFGIAVVNLDLVARQIAADVLRVHDVDVLEPHGTHQELRRRYASVAVEVGLPVSAQERVAEMAWTYIKAAQKVPQPTSRREFSFYE